MGDIIFSPDALGEYIRWQGEDKKTLKRINTLIKDIQRNGVSQGIGKPEPLRYDYQGFWSRRIDDTNRLVYACDEKGNLRILSCKGHYDE